MRLGRTLTAALAAAVLVILAAAPAPAQTSAKKPSNKPPAKTAPPKMDRYGKPNAPDADFVKAAYRAVLSREADPTGLTGNLAALRQGTSRDAVTRGLFLSGEYAALNRGDVDFVKDVYRAYLGRDADVPGQKSWLDHLARGGSRAQLLDAFVASAEYRNALGFLGKPCAPGEEFVKSLYRSALGRESDPGGLASNLDRLNRGAAREQLCKDFFASPEYKGRKRSDTDFVLDVYRACLGRAADDAGVAAWMPLLKGSKNAEEGRAKVVAGVLDSQEYRDIRARCK